MALGKKLALVTCSTRRRRLNPYITSYFGQAFARSWPSVAVETIDLANPQLPPWDEPAIPAQLPETETTAHYSGEAARTWSATVRRYDGFVFVTPQYNWSVPASLKNALDHLFHEWKGKPAAIVTYGGRGGSKAALNLRDILLGLRMRPAPTAPALTINNTMLDRCEELGQFDEKHGRRWAEAGVDDQLASMTREVVQDMLSTEEQTDSKLEPRPWAGLSQRWQ